MQHWLCLFILAHYENWSWNVFVSYLWSIEINFIASFFVEMQWIWLRAYMGYKGKKKGGGEQFANGAFIHPKNSWIMAFRVERWLKRPCLRLIHPNFIITSAKLLFRHSPRFDSRLLYTSSRRRWNVLARY